MSQIPHGWTEAEEQAFQAYSARILEREQEARRTACTPPTQQEPARSLAAPAGSESGACAPSRFFVVGEHRETGLEALLYFIYRPEVVVELGARPKEFLQSPKAFGCIEELGFSGVRRLKHRAYREPNEEIFGKRWECFCGAVVVGGLHRSAPEKGYL